MLRKIKALQKNNRRGSNKGDYFRGITLKRQNQIKIKKQWVMKKKIQKEAI